MSSLKTVCRLLLLAGLLPACVLSTPRETLRAAETAGDSASLASSARPVINDAAQRTLQQIDASIQAGEFAAARTQLRQLLDLAELEGVVPAASAANDRSVTPYESVHTAVLRRLRSLPQEERRQFIRQNEPLASRRLQELLTSGSSEVDLQQIAERYPGTPSARSALRVLLSQLLDRGQVWQAHAVLQMLRRDAAATQQQIAELTERLQQVSALEQPATQETLDGANDAAADEASRGWQAAAAFEDSSVGWFQQALDEHRRQAIPILPRLNPVVAGQTVVGRTLNRLIAVDLQTGRPQWQVESAATGSQRPSRAALTGALESLAAVSMARQVQLDTTYSRMTRDDDRVLCLEQVAGFGRSPGVAQGLNGPSVVDDTHPQNQLVARRVSDGSLAWSRPAFVGTDLGFAPSSAYFLGVPTVHGDWLTGLLQYDAALFLYALDRQTGTPLWMLKIAERVANAAADAEWTSIACPVVSADGLLICSTGAGLIVAVDPVFHRIVWARRYARVDEPPSGSPLPGSASRLTRRWWTGWREITLLPVPDAGAGAALLYSGPDVSDVCVLDAASGVERARVDAAQPLDLQLATSTSGAVPVGLLVERHALTVFHPSTGTVAWTRNIAEPIGRGFLLGSTLTDSVADTATNAGESRRAESHFVFPATDGAAYAIRLSDAQPARLQSIDAGTARTWSLCSAGVLEQTFDDLQLRPLPAITSDGELQWSVGSPSEAAREDELLTSLRTASSPEVLRDRATQAGLLKSTQPQEAAASTPDNDAFDRPGAPHAVVAIERARELQADALAFDLLLSLSEKNPNGAVSLRQSGPERVVRYDRWIQGQLTDLLTPTLTAAPADAAPTAELRTRFAAVIDAARSSRDPFALSRLIERLRDVPGVAAAEAQPEGRVGRSFLQNEIALLRLRTSNEPPVVRDAQRQLIDLYRGHSYQRDAAAVVADQQRAALSRNGETTEDPTAEPLLPAEQTSALLDAAQQSDWQADKPRVDERPDRLEEVRYFPVPVTSAQGTLFDRLNVAVRLVGKTGSSLRFYGDGQAGYWKLELPPSESPLHTWFTLPHGWGIGRLLILRIGTELYGITPYSDSGEPRAQLRWTLDMADGNRFGTHQLAAAVPGFGAEDLTPLDGFDQPLAQVGPVQAGYLCYRDRGLLICLDPETGQQLWTRAEVPPRMRCVGDEQSVWLLDEESQLVTELRAIDGVTLSTFPLSDTASTDVSTDGSTDTARDFGDARLLETYGGRWLFGWPADDTASLSMQRLALVDARSRKVDWSLDTPAAPAVFAVNDAWFGMLDQSGQLEIRDVASNAVIAAHQVDVPAGLRSAYCIADDDTLLIALSAEVDAGFQAVGEPRFGYRTPLINGQLIALRAHDGSLQWQQRIEGERLLLDQPRSLPIVTLTSRSEQPGHALRIVDRRNGQTLLRRKSAEQFTPFTFDPNAALQRVVLRFTRSSLRIDYDAQ